MLKYHVFFMFLTFLVPFFVLISPLAYCISSKPQIISLSLIMDKPTSWSESYYTRLTNFLATLNYRHWTFGVWDNAFDIWIDNKTRLDKLKEYGEVIPRLAYMQQRTQDDKITYTDNVFGNWLEKVGYYPSGIFDYTFPDTFVANHVKDKYGCIYYQGVTFDAYRVDYCSSVGSWQLPYYYDEGNIMLPRKSGRSLVMLPHNLWDWYASFVVSQNVNTHPENLLNDTIKDPEQARNYFFNLIDANAQACEPFAYASIQVEYCWICDYNIEPYVKSWFADLLTKDYDFMSYKEVASWFMAHYDSNPVYQIDFVSPFNNERIEWYWSTKYRIARHNGCVVSFLEYDKQGTDKYLFLAQPINWGKSGNPSDPDNTIDLSLNLTINALRPKTTGSYAYTGRLDQFPLNYVPEKNGLQETVGLAIFVAIASGTVGLIAFILRKGCFKQNRSKN